MAKGRRKERGISYFDYNLLFLVIFMLCFGLVMLYSSSSYTSANKYGDSAHYLRLQLRNIGLGAIALIFFAKVDYRIWKRFGTLAYLVAFGMCTLVILGLGRSSHGSARWLQIGPIQFQPSEISKLAIIIFLAMMIEKIPKQMGKLSALLKIVLFTVLPMVGVIAYSNLSTAVIVFGIAICMLFVSSPKYIHFVTIGAAGLVLVFAFINLASYRGNRIEAWLHPETAGDKGYQTLMGLYAIGSGGLFGKGLGNSLQKLGNVPESQNDMIFTIVCEELGLFGAVCVILLFVLLIWRMMIIANNAKDLFGSLVVVGVMAHISLQVILNIAVVTNSIPNTGVILPFISYGGTSIIFLMAEIGLVLSVSRGIKLENIE